MTKKKIFVLENNSMSYLIKICLEKRVNPELIETKYFEPNQHDRGVITLNRIPNNYDLYFIHNSLVKPDKIQKLLDCPKPKIIALRKTIRQNDNFNDERIRWYGDSDKFDIREVINVLEEIGVIT